MSIKSTYIPEDILPINEWFKYIHNGGKLNVKVGELNFLINKPRKGGVGYQQQQEETLNKLKSLLNGK